jgi:hypothetical protein
MRNFFLKTLLLLIPISLILNGLGTLADRVAPLDDWRSDLQQRYASLTVRKDQLQTIALGSSHADALDFSGMGMEGQSLALAALDLFEMEKYAAFVARELPNLETVFLTLSYYAFSRDNAVFAPLESRRVGFYAELPIWSPIAGDMPNFLLGKIDTYTHVLRVARSDSWQGVWTELPRYPTSTDPLPYDGVRTFSAWGECFHYTAEQLDAHAQEIASRNVSSSRQMADAHPSLELDAFNALARTIELLQARGVRVILFTPAYSTTYNAIFEEQGADLLAQMSRAIGKIQESYGVAYYDFSHDPELSPYPEFFYNSDHLGGCGQQMIRAKVLEMFSEK